MTSSNQDKSTNQQDPALEALVDKLGTEEMDDAIAERGRRRRQEESNKRR